MNCPTCGALFVKSTIRDVCETCYREEEEAFELVNKFIKKRENRTASMLQVVEQTGVSDDLIIKFIKKGRLQLIHFPNLGYPCEKCGAVIRSGTLCDSCKLELKKEIEQFTQEEMRRKELEERERRVTYYTMDEKTRRNR